eukprot:12296428-Prorocentrum_lima.AAC.1
MGPKKCFPVFWCRPTYFCSLFSGRRLFGSARDGFHKLVPPLNLAGQPQIAQGQSSSAAAGNDSPETFASTLSSSTPSVPQQAATNP